MIHEISTHHLPFVPKLGQVVYISSGSRKRIDNYVGNRFEWLRWVFNSRSLDLCTFPQFADQSLVYYAPHLSEYERRVKLLELLESYCAISSENPFLLFSTTGESESSSTLFVAEIESKWLLPLGITFHRLAKEIRQRTSDFERPAPEMPDDLEPDVDTPENDSGSIRFSVRDRDGRLDSMSQQLVNEVIERVTELRNRGVSTAFLHEIIDQGQPLSRLRITKDYHIHLLDYGNLEIKLPSLLKAVYILFLRHSDGIRFKELIDHQDELLRIYRILQPIGSSARQEQSIRELTNPLSNSIHEKCSRIREAFVSRFDPHLARNYYITGKRGEPKRITLDPSYVLWE